MKTEKKLGIWMDHSTANIMEYTGVPIKTKCIESQFTQQEKGISYDKSEKHKHNKEQHQQSEFYKKIGETILNFDDVILFGPTDAKVELLHILRNDHRFAKIKIEIKKTDIMTEYEQHIFVEEYFPKHDSIESGEMIGATGNFVNG